MKLQYNQIFKQAYRITVEHKFLWIFGLFLSLCGLGFTYLGLPNSPLAGSVALVLVSLFLYVVLLIFNFRSMAGLIVGIKAVSDKQMTSFGKSFLAAGLFTGRIFGFFVYTTVILSSLALLLGLPVLFLFNHNLESRGIILAAFGVALFLPVLVLGFIVTYLAPLFIVVFDSKIKEAFQQSFALFLQHWPRLLFLLIIFAIVDLPALFLGQFVLEFRGGLVLSIIGGLVFLLVQTLLSVFQQASWFLVFLELVKPEKIAEEEVVSVPEPIV